MVLHAITVKIVELSDRKGSHLMKQNIKVSMYVHEILQGICNHNQLNCIEFSYRFKSLSSKLDKLFTLKKQRGQTVIVVLE